MTHLEMKRIYLLRKEYIRRKEAEIARMEQERQRQHQLDRIEGMLENLCRYHCLDVPYRL